MARRGRFGDPRNALVQPVQVDFTESNTLSNMKRMLSTTIEYTIGLDAWSIHAADRFDDPAITTFAARSLVAAGVHPSRISEARRDAVQSARGPDIVTWARRPPAQSVSRSAATKASWGTSTRPIDFIFFLPSFCFSSSLRLRLISPP